MKKTTFRNKRVRRKKAQDTIDIIIYLKKYEVTEEEVKNASKALLRNIPRVGG